MKTHKNFLDPKEYTARKGQLPQFDIENAILFFSITKISAETSIEDMKNSINDINTKTHAVLESDYYWAESSENSGKNDFLVVPTGDGYGIALNNIHKDDTILNIAADLYREFNKENLTFKTGIAKGKNILSISINENLTIFGYGVILAREICGLAQVKDKY